MQPRISRAFGQTNSTHWIIRQPLKDVFVTQFVMNIVCTCELHTVVAEIAADALQRFLPVNQLKSSPRMTELMVRYTPAENFPPVLMHFTPQILAAVSFPVSV